MGTPAAIGVETSAIDFSELGRLPHMRVAPSVRHLRPFTALVRDRF